MRARIKWMLLTLLALTVGWLLVAAVVSTRAAAAHASCRNNLKQLGVGLHRYHDANSHFPPGTVPHAELLPEQRLSWLVEIVPEFVVGGVRSLIDKKQGWEAEANRPPRCRLSVNKETGETREEVCDEFKLLLCPACTPHADQPVGPTHYLGIAGLEVDAASLPLTDVRAGLFGYDRKVTLDDIKDGQGTTMIVIESTDGGRARREGGRRFAVSRRAARRTSAKAGSSQASTAAVSSRSRTRGSRTSSSGTGVCGRWRRRCRRGSSRPWLLCAGGEEVGSLDY